MLGKANAHLLPASQSMVGLTGDAEFLVLTVPVTILQGVDDDGNRRLSQAELNGHKPQISAQLTQRL